MTQSFDLNRRTMLKTAGALAGLTAVGGAAELRTRRIRMAAGSPLQFNNADFYVNGKFAVEKAKDAIVALCQHHGYPIFPDLREKLWITDYDTGQFAKLGLAAYMFVNNVPDRYMLMDIFLLPGQMLPEHWHEAAEGNPSKLEGWLVRWGLSHIVGIGEKNLGKDVIVPACHCQVTVEHETVAKPGMFVKLEKVGTRHWQLGGPEGAIITEVATVHTNSGVRHTDPKLNEYFLKHL